MKHFQKEQNIERHSLTTSSRQQDVFNMLFSDAEEHYKNIPVVIINADSF